MLQTPYFISTTFDQPVNYDQREITSRRSIWCLNQQLNKFETIYEEIKAVKAQFVVTAMYYICSMFL